MPKLWYLYYATQKHVSYGLSYMLYKNVNSSPCRPGLQKCQIRLIIYRHFSFFLNVWYLLLPTDHSSFRQVWCQITVKEKKITPAGVVFVCFCFLYVIFAQCLRSILYSESIVRWNSCCIDSFWKQKNGVCTV